MFVVIVALLAVTVALIYKFLKYRSTIWERRGVPCKPADLLVGNLKGINREKHFRDIESEIYGKCKGKGPFAGLYMLVQETVMLMDLDLIKNVLIKDFANFRDRNIFYNERDDPLSGHLFAIEGEKWRVLRTKLTPVFTSGKMKMMFPTVINVAENLKRAITDISAADKDGALELRELCARYTTDVIGTCAFGLECNSLCDPNAEFRQKGRLMSEKSRYPGIVEAFMFAKPQWARALRMKFQLDEVSDFFINAVRSTIDYRITNQIKRNDFMDLMIEMRSKDGVDTESGLSDLQIAAQAFVFFVGGFHTSATAMSLCLYELALNQDIQNHLREEILENLAKHNNELTYEGMNDMQYLDKVLAETLRKYAVLPHLSRYAIKDYDVPNSNYSIKADTTVIIPVYAIHHDPELYPEPQKFDPERFEPEAVKNRHPAAYLPFGDGPRGCIGVRFGKMQTKIGLIYLLKNYKFKQCSKTEIPMELDKRSFLTSSKNGIYLKSEELIQYNDNVD